MEATKGEQGAPEAAWAAGDTLREFRQATARLPGTALAAVAKMIDGIAPSLVELEAHAETLRKERDREHQLREIGEKLRARSLWHIGQLEKKLREAKNEIRRLKRAIATKPAPRRKK